MFTIFLVLYFGIFAEDKLKWVWHFEELYKISQGNVIPKIPKNKTGKYDDFTKEELIEKIEMLEKNSEKVELLDKNNNFCNNSEKVEVLEKNVAEKDEKIDAIKDALFKLKWEVIAEKNVKVKDAIEPVENKTQEVYVQKNTKIRYVQKSIDDPTFTKLLLGYNNQYLKQFFRQKVKNLESGEIFNTFTLLSRVDALPGYSLQLILKCNICCGIREGIVIFAHFEDHVRGKRHTERLKKFIIVK